MKRVKRERGDDDEEEGSSEEEMEDEKEVEEPQSSSRAYGAWSKPNTRSSTSKKRLARMTKIRSMTTGQALAYPSSALLGVIDTGCEEHVVTTARELTIVDEVYSRSNPSTTSMIAANGEEMKVPNYSSKGNGLYSLPQTLDRLSEKL
jgi:hypothetical protein